MNRIDVSRLSVAECMALGGSAGDAPVEGGLQTKLEKIAKEVEKEIALAGRGFKTGLEDEVATQPGDPRGELERAISTAVETAVGQLKADILGGAALSGTCV